jgi:hypothetical protein
MTCNGTNKGTDAYSHLSLPTADEREVHASITSDYMLHNTALVILKLKLYYIKYPQMDRMLSNAHQYSAI